MIISKEHNYLLYYLLYSINMISIYEMNRLTKHWKISILIIQKIIFLLISIMSKLTIRYGVGYSLGYSDTFVLDSKSEEKQDLKIRKIMIIKQ